MKIKSAWFERMEEISKKGKVKAYFFTAKEDVKFECFIFDGIKKDALELLKTAYTKLNMNYKDLISIEVIYKGLISFDDAPPYNLMAEAISYVQHYELAPIDNQKISFQEYLTINN
jgi:hypothetical protein